MEQTAQEWELVRRVRPELGWPPFYEVGEYVARNLRVRLIEVRTRWAKQITTEADPEGWTDPDAEGWRYNLACTKDALRRDYAARFRPTEAEISDVVSSLLTMDGLLARLAERRKRFPSVAKHMRWIEMQAERRGIEIPRGLRGQRNRAISWCWVEVMDIARYVATRRNPLRKLSAAERKMKTVATQAAKVLLPRYAAALADIRTMPSFARMQDPKHIAHFRRVILGQWEPKTNW